MDFKILGIAQNRGQVKKSPPLRNLNSGRLPNIDIQRWCQFTRIKIVAKR